jgi:hypothetical protein
MIKKPKTTRYLVTDVFGTLNEGDKINAIILHKCPDQNLALLFHPKTKGECASLEFAYFDPKEGCWIAKDPSLYVNVEDKKFVEALFGKNFKWTREFFKSGGK